MNVTALKKYIYDKKKIEYVLNELGCGNIKYHDSKDYFSASMPDGDNPMGVEIQNNQYLNFRSYSRNIGMDGKADIITLVEYIKNISFPKAIKYLHKVLGLKFSYANYKKEEKKEKNILDVGVEIFTKYRNKSQVDVNDIHTLDEELIDNYIPQLHIKWFKEGIFHTTAKKFGIAFSPKRSRIIIPHRYWLTGELVGFNMRTTIDNYDEFGIKKYWITPTYQKGLNVYGLWEHYKSIKKVGYVTVFEAEKSVLKRDSLLDESGVAISGKNITDEQVRILIGLNVDIVIAMDKDVSIEEVRFLCEKFYRIRNVYYIRDTDGLLGKKDSPADARDYIYQKLFKNKVKYNEAEHREYLKDLSNN